MNQVKQEFNFHDKDGQFYRFRDSVCGLNHVTNERDVEDELQEGLSLLAQLGPDALLTMILRKWSVSGSPVSVGCVVRGGGGLTHRLCAQPQPEEPRGSGGHLRGAAPRQGRRSPLHLGQSVRGFKLQRVYFLRNQEMLGGYAGLARTLNQTRGWTRHCPVVSVGAEGAGSRAAL